MVKKVVLWILVIACMVTIFLFSSQPSDESTLLSDSLLDSVIRFFAFNADEQTLAFLSVFIRKVAHFSMYALLGSLIFLLMRIGYNVENTKSVIMSPVFSACYAITDEFHQLIVSGRSCQFTDVLIDFAGAVTGTLFLFIIFMILRRKKNG